MREEKKKSIEKKSGKAIRDSPERADQGIRRDPECGEKNAGRGAGKTDYTRYMFSAKEVLRYAVTGLLIGGGIVWLVYHSFTAAPLAVVVASAYLVMTNRSLCAERQKTLQYHFRDFLSSLHTAMAAGYSLENAVRSASSDLEKLYGAEDDLVRETRDMLWQMSYQRPVEQLFRELGDRSGVEDIRQFGEILMIAKRTGGNMDQVLESTWRNLTEKIDTAREIDALVAAKRYEQKLMSLMPAGVILYLKLAFPGFLDGMYGSLTGTAVMTACLGVYLGAFFLGRRMTAQLEV